MSCFDRYRCVANLLQQTCPSLLKELRNLAALYFLISSSPIQMSLVFIKVFQFNLVQIDCFSHITMVKKKIKLHRKLENWVFRGLLRNQVPFKREYLWFAVYSLSTMFPLIYFDLMLNYVTKMKFLVALPSTPVNFLGKIILGGTFEKSSIAEACCVKQNIFHSWTNSMTKPCKSNLV